MSTATEWPRAEVSLSSEGHARVNLGGVEMDLSQPSPQEARAAVVAPLTILVEDVVGVRMVAPDLIDEAREVGIDWAVRAARAA